MTSERLQLPPPAIPSLDEGATRFGSHYHKLWSTCEWKHFLEQRSPHPSNMDSKGLRTKDTPSPLLIGSFLHTGTEWLRRHLVRSGEWDLDLALEHVEKAAQERSREGGAHLADDLRTAKLLLRAYVDWWGPGGPAHGLDNCEIALDAEGEPIIEKLYETPLPGSRYVYTCRVDAMAKWDGWLCVWEYKTVSVYGVHQLFARSHWDLQMTGEVYTLRKNFPDHHVNGVVIDALVKGRGDKSKMDPCYRDQTDRTDSQLDDFERGLLLTLIDMDAKYLRYEELLAEGMDAWGAARSVFRKSGMANGLCQAYGRPCPFLTVCQEPGREARNLLTNYRPRTKPESEFAVRTEDLYAR